MAVSIQPPHLADRIYEVNQSPACYNEHLTFEARQHSRATRAYRGALAPGHLTADITHPQPLAVQRPPPLALQRLPPQQPQPSDTARQLLVPPTSQGHRLKIHTTVLPPAGKLHQWPLTAANICTTGSGRLFITDRNSKQRYLMDMGSNCVFPRKLLPWCRERKDYALYAANGTTIPTYNW